GCSRRRPEKAERGLPRGGLRPRADGARRRARAARAGETGARRPGVRLRGRRRRGRGHPARQRGGVRQVGRRPPGAARRQQPRHLRRIVRPATARSAAARPGGRAGARAPRGRSRRRPRRGGHRRAHGLLQPGLGVDGGLRRRDGRRAAVVPAVLVDLRRAGREPGGSGRGRRLRRAGRHPRHHDARLAPARPRPGPPAVRAGQGHRAVHVGPGLPPARGRARGGYRTPRAAAPAHSGRRAGAGDDGEGVAGVVPRQPAFPAPPRRGRDLPGHLLPPVDHLGRSRLAAVEDAAADPAQGSAAPRRRPPRARRGRGRHGRQHPRWAAGRPVDRRAGRAARDRGCRRRPGTGAAGQRHPQRRRRVHRGGAGCLGGPARPALRVGAGAGRRGGRAAGDLRRARRVRPDAGPDRAHRRRPALARPPAPRGL
ncbi:MAG: L-lactate dehydrogenase, partial [uncultured Blastococcus sp.]